MTLSSPCSHATVVAASLKRSLHSKSAEEQREDIHRGPYDLFLPTLLEKHPVEAMADLADDEVQIYECLEASCPRSKSLKIEMSLEDHLTSDKTKSGCLHNTKLCLTPDGLVVEPVR